MEKLRGVIPPMITPFTQKGELDKEKVKNVAGFLADKVHGLFVCGTYGAGPLMSIEERMEVCSAAVEGTEGKIPVIAHVGTTDTKSALQLAQHAEKAGARAVASLPPYYYSHEEKGIIKYFATLTENLNIPVYLYNNPGTVGYGISPEFLSRLIKETGIRGLKDSSFDLQLFSRFIRTAKEEFDVIMGTGSMFLPVAPLGTGAFIPGTGNALPEIMTDLWEKCEKKDFVAARMIHEKLVGIREVTKKFGPSLVVVQALLNSRGIDAGYPRCPFFPLDGKRKNRLLAELKALDVFFDS